jgi:excisionase family DNA binding protein
MLTLTKPAIAAIDDSPLLVAPDKAAKMLGISVRTLFRLNKSGEIPAVRIGASVRYSPQALDAWVQSKLTDGAAVSGGGQ